MANIRQITVEPSENTTSHGSKANRGALKSLFNSPYGEGTSYDAAAAKAMYQAVLDGTNEDGGNYFGAVDMDYGGAPDYADVPTGGGGLPASPWVPNPSSPVDGVNNPGSIPAAPDGYGTTPADNWGTGVGSQLSPKASSAAIAGQTIGDLPANDPTGGSRSS